MKEGIRIQQEFKSLFVTFDSSYKNPPCTMQHNWKFDPIIKHSMNIYEEK